MKNNIVGENIHFMLDNSPSSEGHGIVVEDFNNNALSVKLTSNCKEFVPGTIILVCKDEII